MKGINGPQPVYLLASSSSLQIWSIPGESWLQVYMAQNVVLFWFLFFFFFCFAFSFLNVSK